MIFFNFWDVSPKCLPSLKELAAYPRDSMIEEGAGCSACRGKRLLRFRLGRLQGDGVFISLAARCLAVHFSRWMNTPPIARFSLLLAGESAVESHKLMPLARIVATHVVGCDPTIMGIGPAEAIRGALQKAGLTLGDMDLVEV